MELMKYDAILSAFEDQMTACRNMYGYFTANVEGSPVVAYIEQIDANGVQDGIDWVFAVRHCDLFDHYLWSEAELYDCLNTHTYMWTFHPGKKLEVA